MSVHYIIHILMVPVSYCPGTARTSWTHWTARWPGNEEYSINVLTKTLIYNRDHLDQLEHQDRLETREIRYGYY